MCVYYSRLVDMNSKNGRRKNIKSSGPVGPYENSHLEMIIILQLPPLPSQVPASSYDVVGRLRASRLFDSTPPGFEPRTL